jgi:hypothetical protein
LIVAMIILSGTVLGVVLGLIPVYLSGKDTQTIVVTVTQPAQTTNAQATTTRVAGTTAAATTAAQPVAS